MKKYSFSFFLLLLITFGYSQKKQGFVVTSKGDTIYGIVSISGRNFKQINLIEKTGKTHSYSNEEINSFYDLQWGLFIAASVRFDISGGELLQKVMTDPTKVFLETIFTLDDISVFYFKNSEYGSHYFIKKGSAPLEELVYREKISEVRGKRVIVKDELYKNTLIAYMSDCPKMQEEIKELTLSEKGIQSLFTKYSGCVSKTPTYIGVLEKGKWSWGILGGWFTSNLIYRNVNPTANKSQFSNSSGVTFGITANYFPSVRNQKISIQNELLYKKLETERTTITNYGAPIVLDYQINYLRLNTLLRYNFKTLAITKPFLLLGISNSFATASSVNDLRTYEQGWILGAGVKIKKVDLFARLENANGFIKPNNIDKISVKSIYFGLIYLLN